MFPFPIRCKRLPGCCWRARCSTCPSSSTPPSPPRAPRPRLQPCVRRRSPRPAPWRLRPADLARGKIAISAWKLHCQPIATSWKPVWQPVENLLKLPTQPVENLLSLLKLPTNQLKTIEPVENLLKLQKCSLLKICWARGKLVEKGGDNSNDWKLKTSINIGWKPVKTCCNHTQEWILTSPKKKGKSPLLHFWCYS